MRQLSIAQKVYNAMRLMDMIQHDHGGCDDSECAMNNEDISQPELLWWWYCSGAASSEFIQLYDLTFGTNREAK